MRHLVRGRKLGRTASHRKATLSALSVALIKSERIITTLAKAKALRGYVEPIITRAKQDSTHNRSHVFRYLKDNKATSRLFDEIGPLVEDRPGGYTRIIKLGVRLGDGAEKAVIELVDFNDSKPDAPGKKKRRTRRGRSGGGKASDVSKHASKKSAADKEKQVAGKASAADKKELKAAEVPEKGAVKADTDIDSGKEKAPEAAEEKAGAVEKSDEKAKDTKDDAAPVEGTKKAEKNEEKTEAVKSSESGEKSAPAAEEKAAGDTSSETDNKDGDDAADAKASKE